MLVQAPVIEFICLDTETACPGPYNPPLIEAYIGQLFGQHCTWGPIVFPIACGTHAFYGFAAGCNPNRPGGIGVPDEPPSINKWYVRTSLAIHTIPQGGHLEPHDLINSLFINFDAPNQGVPGTPNEQCLPPGLYTHVVTWALPSNDPDQCNPMVTAPTGDLMVIEI